MKDATDHLAVIVGGRTTSIVQRSVAQFDGRSCGRKLPQHVAETIEKLPEDLKGSLPTIEALEKELGHGG